MQRRLDPHARLALTAAAGASLAMMPFGWHAGYHAPSDYMVVFVLLATTLLASLTIVAHGFPWTGSVDAAIRIGVLAFAVVVTCGLLLGSVGLITPGGYLGVLALVTALALVLARRGTPRWGRFSTPPLDELPITIVGIFGALLVFLIGFAMTHAPLTLYDSLSYHLFFSARWLLDHRVAILPTPFSDEAQAYTPGNGELYLLWLMLPFHGDLLARAGQFPFALLAATVVYALARRLGARREHAIYPAAFFLLSRQVLEQAVGANVDLICAATFLASLYLGILAVERNGARDWGLWGVSLGLYWGTKYLALVYTPIFLLLMLARGIRPKALWAVPGVMAFAMPWYLRNWLVAGSPIYPASLQVAGLTLARGAFGRAAMFNTVFHTDEARLLPVMAAHLFGPTLFLFWLPFALVGGWWCVRRGGWWPNGFVLLVPVLAVPLYWFGSPVNIDSRFLMPALGAALLPFAFAFRTSRAWNGAVHLIYVIGMLWVIVGVHTSIPAALPWFMGDWLALNGLVQSRFVIAFAVMAIAMAAAWRALARRSRFSVVSMALLVWAAALALTLGADRWCLPSKCDYLDTTSPFVRPTLIDAWAWVTGNVRNSTVAYTGINLPYPLSGDRLTNRVIYANIDGHPRWRLHDYDRAYREGRFVPQPPLLATSSGELRAVGQRSGPRDDAARPRYERMEGFRDGWIANLAGSQVTYLFVSALSAYEIDYVWHNSGGFPIEDEWAKSDPAAFDLVYENPQVRIYAVTLPRKTGA